MISLVKKIVYLLPLIFAAGCTTTATVVESQVDGTEVKYSEAAYAQKSLTDQVSSVADCVKNCSVKASDFSEGGQIALAVVSGVTGKPLDLCGCLAGVSGRNYFDAQTEIAQSRHSLIGKSIGAVTAVATGAIIGSAVEAGFEASSKGRNYTTNIGNVSQSTSKSSSGGAGLLPGEEGGELVLPGSPSANGASGIESNSIIIGGEQNITGEDLVYGQNQELQESATGVLNTDTKNNGSHTADEFTGDPINQDDDGGNSALDF